MKNKLTLIYAVIFYLIAIVIWFADSNNRLANGLFIIATVIPNILGSFPFLNLNKSMNYEKFKENFYFSGLFLYLGYLLAITSNATNHPDYFTNGLFLSILAALYIGIILFSLFMVNFNSVTQNEETTKKLIENETIPIKEFLKIAKNKNANILAVAGNLKALKSNEGVKLLKEFLSNSSRNKLELFIPEDSVSFLKDLKRNFNDNELAKRVTISIIKPFVFLQGIVFAGQKLPTDTGEGISTKGYYLYKPILSSEDVFSDKGIFIDVSELSEEDNYSAAIASYYRHLNGDYFRLNGFVYRPGIFSINDKNEENVFNHIKETKTLDKVTLK